jgi:hypothetical protein
VVFGARGQVGVDIERSDRQICDRVIRRLLPPRRADTLPGLDPCERARPFFEQWTSERPAKALPLDCPPTLIGTLSVTADLHRPIHALRDA